MDIKDYGRMFRSITANVNNYISARIEKYGIKQGQYEYFLLIYSSQGINQLEIARQKNVGKASVTKALKILEDDGFIKRVIDDNDRRNVLCFTTQKGEAIVENLINVKKKAEARLFTGFTESDKEAFFSFLSLFYDNSTALISDAELQNIKD